MVIRTPDGEEAASAGNPVCFPAGPDGAHMMVRRADAHVYYDGE